MATPHEVAKCERRDHLEDEGHHDDGQDAYPRGIHVAAKRELLVRAGPSGEDDLRRKDIKTEALCWSYP